MKNMSISIKLFLSNFFYCIPVLVLIWTTVRPYNENIDFANSEKKGVAYQKALESFFQQIGTHGVVAQRALHNDAEAKAALTAIEQKADEALITIGQVNSKLGEALQFTDKGLAARQREAFRFESLQKEWTELKTKLAGLSPAESNDKHAHLIATIRGMITHLGDTSNLILDPELDSYYLADITLGGLPQMQERLFDILTKTEAIVRKGAVTVEDRIWAATSSALLKGSDLDRITGDAQTSINEDKNFNGVSVTLQENLPKATKQLQEPTEAVLKYLDGIAAGKLEVSIADWLTTSAKTFDKSFELWYVGDTELNKLLEARNQFQGTQKNNSVLFGIGALIIAAILSTLMGLSIKSGIVSTVSSTIEKLNGILSIVKDSNQALVDVANGLASGTTQQASAVQETAATLDQISAMTEKSAGTAESTADQAQKTKESTESTKHSVQEMVEAFNQINTSNEQIFDQVNQTNEQIISFMQMIQEIDSKTKIINDIVFQTKLLSFNASVEAARAGEFGKGFAVVAEEVGNLAVLSGTSSKEISELLAKTNKKVSEIVTSAKANLAAVVTESKERMQNGLAIAGDCERNLDGASTKVNSIAGLMKDLAIASKEQSTGIFEITKAMRTVDEATQQNSVAANTVSKLASELDQQSTVLGEAIADLEQRIGKQKAA